MYAWEQGEADCEPDPLLERMEICLHALLAMDDDGPASECLDFLPDTAQEAALEVIDALQPQITPA